MKSVHICIAVCSFLGLALPHSASGAPDKTLTVDFDRVTGPLDSNLWSSSGVDQGLLTKAFDQDMQLIGSVPYNGCRWMRPHFLLNLVKANGLGTATPTYDWTDLDSTLDTIVRAGLTPLFELMGNPSSHFTNFLEKDQVYAWKQLVADLTVHLEKRFGAKEVRSWLFESWNEPDINNYWKWKSPQEHQNYYDACSEGLKAGDPLLRFGGPGIARTVPPYSKFFQSFLNHVDTGTNYFTGEKGVRLDFISFHIKNRPKAMVDSESSNINSLLKDHPRFATLPIFNDEADSEVQWNHPYDHRATPWYAAFIARSVNEHLTRVSDGESITNGQKIQFRLSNDDAFWGPWAFRSQFTQFGTNERFAFIKKPSHTVRTALALLGNERCAVDGFELSDNVGAIATRQGADHVAILIYNYVDKTDASGSSSIQLNLTHLPFRAGKWVQYRIDSAHGDTHAQWVAMGSPTSPTDDQIQALRNYQELGVCEPISDVEGPTLSHIIDLPLPGVSLIVVAADPGVSSATIHGLYATPYPSLSGQREDILLKWSSIDRLVQTYEVLHADAQSGPFLRVNPSDQIETSFVYQTPIAAAGFAKIRARDYWGRIIAESDPIALLPAAAK